MAKKPLPTPEVLRQLLSYDPETGVLTWRLRTPEFFFDTDVRTASHSCANWNAHYAGRPAFTSKDTHGYFKGAISSKTLLAHRVAWALHFGEWPGEIDHINGDRSDNRICNLREASRSENQQNRPLHSKNTSGFPGVSFDKAANKFRAIITINRNRISLGLFDDAAQAGEAYRQAKKRHHRFAPEVRS